MAAQIVFGSVDAYGAKRSSDEVRIIREMLAEDIELFGRDSGVDERAVRELKSEQPEIQWAVLQRGPVRSAANPSAALVGRIRDAKRGIAAGRSATAPMGPPAIMSADGPLSDVDKFIMENRVDQSAASSLQAEAADVQKIILSQGPLVNCSNPSGALMGRIRAARKGDLAYKPNAAAATPAQAPAAPLALGGLTAADSGAATSSVDMGRLAADAAKAIEMLSYGGAAQPDASAGAGAAAAPAGVGAAPANVEDARLQQEALKAIQMLNADYID
eukprot:CAMPEP_0195081228 /NCGR_PEP_ID=MMETSP0448-20130528/22742_1 /TAXON_ID=66468 /ORGANISM="Heterocapsa triquestra, Strain CCMP 448" /LENGTH=273 /DNA_ID=CAMNT_0040114239 /DNA_START=80 /DNA_END=901 /DNA_ORIENTATION=-